MPQFKIGRIANNQVKALDPWRPAQSFVIYRVKMKSIVGQFHLCNIFLPVLKISVLNLYAVNFSVASQMKIKFKAHDSAATAKV